jgi:hypothetical protein
MPWTAVPKNNDVQRLGVSFSARRFSDQDDIADFNFHPQFVLPFAYDSFLQGHIPVHAPTRKGENIFSSIDILHAEDLVCLFKNCGYPDSHRSSFGFNNQPFSSAQLSILDTINTSRIDYLYYKEWRINAIDLCRADSQGRAIFRVPPLPRIS